MRNSNRHSWALPLLIVGVLLAGCGGDDDTDQADAGDTPAADEPGETPAPADAGDLGTTDACELLTTDEIAAVAGNAVLDGKNLGVCIWEPADLSDDTNVQVSAVFVPFGGGADPEEMCAAGLPGIPDSEPYDAGLGNSAYWDFGEAQLANSGSLHICLDQGFVDTGAIGLRPEAELQQIAVTVAETLISRI